MSQVNGPRQGAPKKRPAASRVPYDELVLQWAMSASEVPSRPRGELLHFLANNRRRSRELVAAAAEGRPAVSSLPTDPFDAEIDAAAEALSACDRRNDTVQFLRSAAEESVMLLSKECKMELAWTNHSESIFGKRPVVEELAAHRDSLERHGLRVIERVVWHPTPLDTATVAVYEALAPEDPTSGAVGAPWLRRRDVVHWDSSGTVRLVTRTLLFHCDDVTRGPQHIKWRPHFGTIL